MNIDLILTIVGLILLALAALKIPDRMVSWGWAGLFVLFLRGLIE